MFKKTAPEGTPSGHVLLSSAVIRAARKLKRDGVPVTSEAIIRELVGCDQYLAGCIRDVIVHLTSTGQLEVS